MRSMTGLGSVLCTLFLSLAPTAARAGIVIEPVPGSGGMHTSLAFDRSGRPAVAYLGADGVQLARRTGHGFEVEAVDAAGPQNAHALVRKLALGIDGADEPVIAYADDQNLTVKLARRTAAGWEVQQVDDGFSLGYSLAIDLAGNAAFTWAAGEGMGGVPVVKLARQVGAGVEVVVVPGQGDGYAAYTALAFDAAGHPAVAYSYVRFDRYTLMLARFDGTEWRQERVPDPSDSFGTFPSLAFDAAGNPAVSYVAAVGDVFNYAALRLARRTDSGWTIALLDGDAGGSRATGHTSLAFDRAGAYVVSYYSGYEEVLKLKREGLRIETVDDDDTPGLHSSLAFDHEGNLAIAYRTDQGPRLARFLPDLPHVQRGGVLSLPGTRPVVAAPTGGAPAIP